MIKNCLFISQEMLTTLTKLQENTKDLSDENHCK